MAPDDSEDRQVIAGRRYFYFKRVMEAYGLGGKFEDHVYTLLIARTEKTGRLCQITDGKKSDMNVASDHLLPVRGLTNRQREKIYRLCRLIGLLSQVLDDGHEIEVVNLTAEDIIGFKNGRGAIAAFLNKQDHRLWKNAMDYVEGRAQSLRQVYPKRAKPGKKTKEKSAPKPDKKSSFKLTAITDLESARAMVEKAYLEVKQVTIGQDDALKGIIVRALSYLKSGANEPLLVAGPTGVGKTHSIRTIADAMGIPFGRVVTPDLTPTGYVGANIQNAIAGEVKRVYERYSKPPSRMILQIDEFDKVVVRGETFTGMIQNELLKLLEPDGFLTIDEGRWGNVETIRLNAMVVLSGAFSFLKDMKEEIDEGTLKKAGFIDELIGRIGTPITLRKLEVADFMAMLTTDPSLPFLAASTKDLSEFGIDTRLEPAAMEYLAQLAAESDMGARKLSTDFRKVVDRMKTKLLVDKENKPEGITVEDVREGRRVFRVSRQFVERTIKHGTPEKRIGFRS